jgi:hypothetical protein
MLVEISRTSGDVEGVGQFGLTVLGRNLTQLLHLQGVLTARERDLADVMIAEHERAGLAKNELLHLTALAKRHGYTLVKK